MQQSYFKELVDKYVRPYMKKWVDTVNGSRKGPTYLFKTMLRREFSVFNKWAAISGQFTNVAADIVALDSDLSIKKRDSVEKASGDIPKLGMKIPLKESQMKEIRIMRATGATEKEIVAKLFNDLQKGVTGIWEAIEDMFLRGLSTGVALLADENRPGLAVRVKYNIPDENFKKVAVKWDTPATATPLDDVQKVVDAADEKGDTFVQAMACPKVINNMAKTDQGKLMYANFKGIVLTTGTNLTKFAAASRKDFRAAFENRFGFPLIEVSRSIKYEKDGKQTTVKPFDEDNMVFLTSEQVGTLTYGVVEEKENPVPGVTYTEMDGFILGSKYMRTEPSVNEMTAVQAVVVPVLENVDQIYILDTLETA